MITPSIIYTPNPLEIAAAWVFHGRLLREDKTIMPTKSSLIQAAAKKFALITRAFSRDCVGGLANQLNPQATTYAQTQQPEEALPHI